MKKSELIKVLKEELSTLYPKGGSIGGPHKTPIKDKEFTGTGTLPKGQTKAFSNLFREKYMKLANRYFGIPWDVHGNPDTPPLNWFLDRLVSTLKWEERNREGDTYNKFAIADIKSILSELPKGFSEHFGIDLNSDQSILSFLKHGQESFLGNYKDFTEEFNKINWGEK